jgi:hypothetical protein
MLFAIYPSGEHRTDVRLVVSRGAGVNARLGLPPVAPCGASRAGN